MNKKSHAAGSSSTWHSANFAWSDDQLPRLYHIALHGPTRYISPPEPCRFTVHEIVRLNENTSKNLYRSLSKYISIYKQFAHFLTWSVNSAWDFIDMLFGVNKFILVVHIIVNRFTMFKITWFVVQNTKLDVRYGTSRVVTSVGNGYVVNGCTCLTLTGVWKSSQIRM